jgi:hypothetical protein
VAASCGRTRRCAVSTAARTISLPLPDTPGPPGSPRCSCSCCWCPKRTGNWGYRRLTPRIRRTRGYTLGNRCC